MRGGRGAQLPRLGVTECSGGDQHPGFREDRQVAQDSGSIECLWECSRDALVPCAPGARAQRWLTGPWQGPRQAVQEPQTLKGRGSTRKKPKGSLGPHSTHREACSGLRAKILGEGAPPGEIARTLRVVVGKGCGSGLSEFAWRPRWAGEPLTRQGYSTRPGYLAPHPRAWRPNAGR